MTTELFELKPPKDTFLTQVTNISLYYWDFRRNKSQKNLWCYYVQTSENEQKDQTISLLCINKEHLKTIQSTSYPPACFSQ